YCRRSSLVAISCLLDAYDWTRHPSRSTLHAGRWTLYAGRCTLDAGRWTLDAGRWTLDDFGRLPSPVKRSERLFASSFQLPASSTASVFLLRASSFRPQAFNAAQRASYLSISLSLAVVPPALPVAPLHL